MSKLSNSYMLKLITRLLILLAIAKSISLVIWWFLPSDGVELQTEDNYNPKYQRVDFVTMLESNTTAKSASGSNTGAYTDNVSITNMILKGLYGKDSSGFAIVSLKSSPETTSIVPVGDNFSGYVLKTILGSGVIFTKNNQEYVLEIDNATLSPKLTSAVTDFQEPVGVSRADIKFYAENPKQIWNDIAISEVKDGNEIKGFKVNQIGEKSKMSELGLQKGDVIVEVNNTRLKSYKDALDIYKNIDKISTMQIVVIRNNIEMELVYEIH